MSHKHPWARITILFMFLAGMTAACTSQQPTPPVSFTDLPTLSAELPSQPVTSETPPLQSTLPVDQPEPSPLTISLLNTGFEEQDADGKPSGWQSSGAVEAVMIEERGHSGNFRLTHKSTQAYRVETWQKVNGLDVGWYTLSAWVRSSGGQNEVYLALECSGVDKRTAVPSTSPGYRWLHLVVSNESRNGECTIRLVSNGEPNTWVSIDDLELSPGRIALSILGADISSLKKSEDYGGVYRYPDGTPADALQILKDYGLNYARLRVWVNSPDGYHEKDELLEMAKRLKEKGIKLLVDFHYSDHWADPGKQIKPAAWKDLSFEQLKQAVYDHTYDVCSSLAAQGTPPDMVQLGNEINAGMLWPDGDYNHFDNLAELLKAGHQAVRDCSPSTLVMLHIAEGGDNDMARWWFDNITRRNVPFDVIGISYYPFWHGTLPQLQGNLNDISERYDKDVIVVETAYAFTDQNKDELANIASPELMTPGYPFTPDGQRAMLRDIMSTVRGVLSGRGLGVFWWVHLD
ncbi:MAG: glycosyl hydrolase 53 family protein, partial [Anaerolineales bacterium]